MQIYLINELNETSVWMNNQIKWLWQKVMAIECTIRISLQRYLLLLTSASVETFEEFKVSISLDKLQVHCEC